MDKIEIIIDQALVDEFNGMYFKEHPRATKPAILKPSHPSLNLIFSGTPFQRREQKHNWNDFIEWIIRKNNLNDLQIDKCKIIYETYFGDKRPHDLDNISPKFILDAFVSSGMLVADDYKHIKELATRCFCDLDYARMRFIIYDIELKESTNE